MKKIISVILVLCLLCPISVLAFSDTEMDIIDDDPTPDVCFSVTGAEGYVGDTVQVKVSLTKNPGIWAAKFNVNFDSSVLKLKDAQNGTVFRNGEFIKSKLDFDGYYIYYAQLDNFGENNTNTGVILTLTFDILDGAKAGDTSVYLTFDNHGKGWYFSGKNPNIDYTVPDDGEVRANVTVSEKSVVPGDLNGDGKVNAVDMNLIKRLILGVEFSENLVKSADINGDKKINAVDANLLKLIVLGAGS